jgi:hypothetical protein
VYTFDENGTVNGNYTVVTDTRYSSRDGSFCNGHSENFTRETNVLCLPREECERLCTKASGCHSFDMHATLPRCYLNTVACSDEMKWVASGGDYDIALKHITPTAEEDPLNDEGRMVYVTHSTLDCSGYGAPLLDATTGNRKGCELLCTLNEDCMFFWVSGGMCTQFGEDFDPAGCHAGPGPVPHSLDHYTGQLVAKVLPQPCTVTVTHADSSASAHPRREDDRNVYNHMHNVTRIKYFSSTMSGECDGWKLQQNEAPLEHLDFENCTDKEAGARIWLAAYHVNNQVVGWQDQYDERFPELPCFDQPASVAAQFLGITESQFTMAGGCGAIVPAFLGMNINSTTDLAQPGLQSTFWWRQIPNGTTLCHFCCATFYEQNLGECPELVVANSTTNESSNTSHYLWYKNDYNMPHFPSESWTFPCQWGEDEGFCANPVFRGLCPHTCQDLKFTVIGNDRYSLQELVLYGTFDGMNSTCQGSYDNNWAMYKFRTDGFSWVSPEDEHPSWNEAGTPTPADKAVKMACDESVQQRPTACYHDIYTPIVLALCPSACRKARLPSPPPAPMTPDEADYQGASSRRLGMLRNGYTTSYSGTTTTSYRKYYLPYHVDNAMWSDIYTTWMNGSSSLNSPSAGAYWQADGTFVPGTATCPPLGGDVVDKYGALTTDKVYNAFMTTVDMSITPVCRKASVCPSLTVCVLNEQRMQDEMSVWRMGVRRGAFLSEIDVPERDPVLAATHFEPKVLLSADRAEALIDASKWEFAHSIYRTVPMATRVVPTSMSDFGDKTVISMVSSELSSAVGTEGQGVQSQEFGRTYGAVLPGLLEPWRTDVIRIERFHGDGTPKTEGMFQFKVYAPEMESDHLIVYRYGPVLMTPPVDITTEGGSVTKLNEEGMWMVTVTSVNADFIGTEDVNECVVNFPCAEGDGGEYTVDAICTNRIGAAPLCSCPPGFSGDGYPSTRGGTGTPCTIDSITYTPEESQDYYIAIRHADRLDYGWRVREIKLYADYDSSKGECKGAQRYSQIKQDFPVPDVADDTYTYITQPFNVYTGDYGHAFYPKANDDPNGRGGPTFSYGPDKLFDEYNNNRPSAGKAWWSACLNCNPEEVDNTHQGAVEILIGINGETPLNCIGIHQVEGHDSKSLIIERGPMRGPGCGMKPGETRCNPTMRWAKSGIGIDDTVVTSCGLEQTYFYGELLILEGTEKSGHYGSVGAKARSGERLYVPSACHCQALCISYLDKGCRSYVYDTAKYGQGAGHCYLQTNVFKKQSSAGAFPDYVSGTPYLRVGTFEGAERKLADAAYLQSFSFDPPPMDGVPFDLTIHGVGLPFNEAKAQDTSDFQRVKIVEKNQGCHEEIPKEVVGIGCAKSTRVIPTMGGSSREQTVYTICSPRPDRATSEHVTWTGLTITAGADAKEYSVCYCRGNCFTPANWEKVLGTFSIAPATFTWTTAEEMVYRKSEGGLGALQLRVKRPPFGSFSDAGRWELKLVREHFDCSVVMDASKFLCADAAPNEMDTTAPALTTDLTAASYPHDGIIVVSFDEYISTVGCTGNWTLTQGATTQRIGCDQTINFGNTVVLVPPAALTVGAANLAWDSGVVLDANSNANDADDEDLTIVDGATISGFDVLTSNPPNGGVIATSTLTVFFARSTDPLTFPNASVTVTDCGVDAVCGSDDDFDEDDIMAMVATSSGAAVLEISGVSFMPGRFYRASVPTNTSAGEGTYMFTFSYGCPFPGTVNGPDVATWNYDLDVAVTEVGNYQVCFRDEVGTAFKSIPSETGAKYVEILKIDADSTHPRGVFHNQYFSALNGASFIGSFTVAGTRLSVPSDSKVLLSRGTCSSPGTFSFAGTISGVASTDTMPPQMVVSGNYPADAGAVGMLKVVRLAFSEALSLDACGGEGNITIVNSGTGVGTGITCEDFIIVDNVVIVPVNLAAATYHVVVDTGALQDKRGNAVTKIDSSTNGGTYSFTVDTSTTPPQVIYSYPSENDKYSGQPNGNETMNFHFNVDVTPVVGEFVSLYDCGADYVCSQTGPNQDQLIYRWASINVTASGNIVGVDATGVLGDLYRRYRIVFPTGLFTGSLEYDIEFVNDRTGFEHAFVMTADPATSDADGLVFNAKLHDDVATGIYNLCYCDDQSDDTLEDMGDGETTYQITDDVKQLQTDLLTSTDVAGTTVPFVAPRGGADLSHHECHTKCSMGCTGPTCYCDGYTGAARDPSSRDVYFCLPASLCRDACDAFGANCTGINVHDVLSQCLLSTSADLTVADVAEEWQFFEKLQGSACTQVHDFDQTSGQFAVTSRVDVEVEYVVTPEEEVSIELTTPATLTFSSSAHLLSKDRITVIDSLGTCGLSSPSASVQLPEGATDIKTWAAWAPWSYFQDEPWDDDQNDQDLGKVVEKRDPAAPMDYNVRPGMYCPEHNMDLDDLAVPMSGVAMHVKEHQCYTKCALKAPCTGANCFCDGYFSGFDDLSSNAICGNQALCQYVCDNTDGCKSIDMHTNGNRCFLNSESCGLHQDSLAPAADGSYNLLIKRTDPNDEQRRLEGHGANVKEDYSWDKMLRFKPLKIATGGTFKVCFCDSTLLSEGSVCSTESDFSIEVGTIHSSGVSCLLERPALQRVSCVEQRWGGLRCYESYDAPAPQLERVPMNFVNENGVGLTGDSLTAFCALSPQEAVCNPGNAPNGAN